MNYIIAFAAVALIQAGQHLTSPESDVGRIDVLFGSLVALAICWRLDRP